MNDKAAQSSIGEIVVLRQQYEALEKRVAALEAAAVPQPPLHFEYDLPVDILTRGVTETHTEDPRLTGEAEGLLPSTTTGKSR